MTVDTVCGSLNATQTEDGRRSSCSEMTAEKTYSRLDRTLRLVDRPDDLDPYSDGPTALMSCGHAVTPDSLTGWCRSLLQQKQFTFTCPANVNGAKCNAVWPYEEVRKMAMLTDAEKQYFEETIVRLAASEYFEFKGCPGCKTNVERQNLTNLNVRCTICTARNRQVYEFCWQCLKPWKGLSSRSDRCDNDGCTNPDLQLLKTCAMTNLPQVEGVKECPSIRACPTCGKLLEHDKTGCKNLCCPRCRVEFCFLCLKLTLECQKTSSYFRPCSVSVAPRQTSIPVWHRK